jgi:Chaperone of endosialidase
MRSFFQGKFMQRFNTLRSLAALLSSTCAMLITASAHSATCPFDGGGSDAINDGLVLTRFALNITGAPMLANTRYESVAGLTPDLVQANITCAGCGLDMNGDNQVDTVDATIVARRLAGFTGNSLTNGLALGSGARSTPAAVQSFLIAGCAGAGVTNPYILGGNAFGTIGTPATLGTTDGKPLHVGLGSNRGLRMAVSGDTAVVSVDVINGASNNSVSAGAIGGTVAGGGCSGGTGCSAANANTVDAAFGTVSGGNTNYAWFYGAVGGGFGNRASGNFATAPGGDSNDAYGDFSFVGGRGAKAYSSAATPVPFHGAFVWADSNGNAAAAQNFYATAVDQFAVRARGGVAFRTTGVSDATSGPGCAIPAGGGAWTCTSDRNLKEAIAAISPRDVLSKVAQMAVTTWQFKGNERRYMGPMAQDFRAAFGLGDDDKSISTTDASGVALAAIQGLNQMVQEKEAEIAALRKAHDELKRKMAAIEKRLGL